MGYSQPFPSTRRRRSAAGSRALGPRLAITKRAVANLGHAFPEKGAGEITAIVKGMWDNLGRTAAEYPHSSEIEVYGNDGRVEVGGG